MQSEYHFNYKNELAILRVYSELYTRRSIIQNTAMFRVAKHITVNRKHSRGGKDQKTPYCKVSSITG